MSIVHVFTSLMDIHSEPGTKIRYAYPKHGMKHDQEQCAALLEEGKVYTVKSCRVYDAHTSVVLEEVPDQTFNSVMFADVTTTGDLGELGGLSADERDQLAADLQREQQAVGDIGDLTAALRRQMEAEQRQRYGTDPTATAASRSETHQREHVTDGTPCWCKPTIEDYRAGNRPDGLRAGTEADLDPDDVVSGIDASTGLSLHTPIVNAEGGGAIDPRDIDRGPLRPLNDQVFLVRVQLPDTTASGLAIPESAQSKGCECRVLAAGPGAKNARTGKRIPMSVAAGDRVVIGKWQGNEVTIPDYVRAWWNIDDREPVIVVRETEILAVLAPMPEVSA